MPRSIVYFILGTIVSFALNFFLLESQGWALDLYYAVSFGLAWGMAYFLDTEYISLPKKLGISFLGMLLLFSVGMFLFGIEQALPSAIKFSIVFVAYYLLASLRGSKSLKK